jgi:hypothetical protein
VDYVEAPATPRPARVTAAPVAAPRGQAAEPEISRHELESEPFENRAVDQREVVEDTTDVLDDLAGGELPDSVEARIEEATEAVEGGSTSEDGEAAGNQAEGDEQAPA